MLNKKIKCFDEFIDSNFILDDFTIHFRIPVEIQKELDFNKTLSDLGFVSEDFGNWYEFNDHLCDSGFYLIISSNNDEMRLAVIDAHEFTDLMCDLCCERNAKVTFGSTCNFSDGSNIVKSNIASGSIMAPMMELFKK